MNITISYDCDERDAEQRATCKINIHDGHGHIDWEFTPPVCDDTSDPCGLITKLINAVTETLSAQPKEPSE